MTFQGNQALDESVQQVMQTLPLPIKKYLQEGKYTSVAQNVMRKYQLHIDQGTILERELMLLLMGIESPQEFNAALIEEAHIDQQAVNNIMLDVNAQIFIPLRDQMRAAGDTQAQATQKTSQQQPVPKAPPPPPVYVPAPPAPTQPQQARPIPPIHPAPVGGQSPQPIAPQAPRSDLAAAIQKATQSPPPQLQSVVSPPQPMPEPMKEAVRSAPVAPPQSEPPKTRPYSVDPYREPVDES